MQKHLLLWSNRKTAGTQDPALVQGRDLLLLREGRKITLIKDSHLYRAEFDWHGMWVECPLSRPCIWGRGCLPVGKEQKCWESSPLDVQLYMACWRLKVEQKNGEIPYSYHSPTPSKNQQKYPEERARVWRQDLAEIWGWRRNTKKIL